MTNDLLTDIFGATPPAAAKEPAARVSLPEPGIYDGVPNEIYHALPFVSNSYLSKLDKCPAAAKVPQEQTAAMTFGSAAHCFILEGEEVFFTQYCVAPDCDRRTKAGKEMFADFQAANAGKTVISTDDLTTILSMAEAIKSHPFASKIIAQGISEQSVFWQDEQTGLMCRCRPDRIPEGNKGVLVDLKTTDDASESGFTRSAIKYGYIRQAAFYMDGMTIASGARHDIFTFIAVEKKPPYRVEVYVVPEDFADWGRREYRRLLDLEVQCQNAGSYPHYINQGPTELTKPAWL